jgi:AI-2 transport system permease protein
MIRRLLKSREVLVLGLLVAVLLAVATVNRVVLLPFTLINIGNSSLFLMLLAIGQMFVILTRGIDVSIGAIAGLSAVIFGLAMNAGVPLPVAMLASVLTGALAGAVNGAGIAILGVPPIIMTLSTLGIYRGAMRLLTGGSWIEQVPQSIKALSTTRIGGLPLMLWAVFALVIVLALAAPRIRAMRLLYAVGDNREGAYLLGLNVRVTEFMAYALAGAFGGMAAVVFVAQIGFVPMQTGQGQELKAIAAVVLGGVSLMGGSGSVWSAVIGALFLTTVDSMLIFLKVPGAWNNAVAGAVLLTVVVADFMIRRTVARRQSAARSAELRRAADDGAAAVNEVTQ